MKFFYCPTIESPLKIGKIAVYRFLISFLVSVLRFKNLKNDRKMVQGSGGKSVKIDKICDVMWWISDSSDL